MLACWWKEGVASRRTTVTADSDGGVDEGLVRGCVIDILDTAPMRVMAVTLFDHIMTFHDNHRMTLHGMACMVPFSPSTP